MEDCTLRDNDYGLYVQNLSPRAVLDQVIRETLRVQTISRRVLSSTIYQHFLWKKDLYGR